MTEDVSLGLMTAALAHPEKKAIVLPTGQFLNFAQYDAECNRFAQFFRDKGIRPGMRVLVFVRPGFSFVPTIFGLFRIGAVAVCIDPGMKLGQMLKCISEVQADAMVGIPRAKVVAFVFGKAFETVRIRVTVPKIYPGKFVSTGPPEALIHPTAAILFTSGSTGVPKGVVYTHEAFRQQSNILKRSYSITPEDVDLVLFPLFALFTADWGITAVVSKLNPSKPAKASGEHLADVINRFSVTHTSGSPAIFRRLAEARTPLPTLKRILMAGAQVPENLVRYFAILGVAVHTPYGATEALPLTDIDNLELAKTYDHTHKGGGTCVGRPLPGVQIAVMAPTEDVISKWESRLALEPFVIGEIVAKAPWISKGYFNRPEATRKARIESWHRMGDVGYLDEQGRLWFCGRKDHRIHTDGKTVYPDPIEAMVDSAFKTRSALVGIGPKGKQKAVLVVEGRRSKKLAKDLKTHAQMISEVTFRRRLPVDVRHNIKLDRPRIARDLERSL